MCILYCAYVIHVAAPYVPGQRSGGGRGRQGRGEVLLSTVVHIVGILYSV